MGALLARTQPRPVTVARYQGGVKLTHAAGPVAFIRPLGHGVWDAFVHGRPELGPERTMSQPGSELRALVDAALDALAARPEPTDIDPEAPLFAVGEDVEVEGKGPHQIRERQWHGKGGYWYYLLRKPTGAKVSSRHRAEELTRSSPRATPEPSARSGGT